jgi:hypothetical protein
MRLFGILLAFAFLCGCTTVEFEEDMGKDRFGNSGGWSATGTMRNNGNSHTAHLQVNFLEKETRPSPSKNYTVQFSVGPTIDRTTKQIRTDVSVRPQAEIKWSVEGNDVRRVVDVTNGMSLTGVGEAIRVTCSDASNTNGTDPVDYDVSITVAPGSRASVQQPPSLSFLFDDGIDAPGYLIPVPANTTKVIAIPQNSGVISAFITAVAVPYIVMPDGIAEVRQIAAGGFLQRRYDPLNQSGWVPIVNGAVQLALVNHFAATTELEYSVTFGIDG